MSLFEFLMVLVSIIIGLGLAEILSGVAKLIRARATIRPYWIHAVAVVVLFIALLQQWWEIWGLRAYSEWTFTGLLMMLSGPLRRRAIQRHQRNVLRVPRRIYRARRVAAPRIARPPRPGLPRAAAPRHLRVVVRRRRPVTTGVIRELSALRRTPAMEDEKR